MPGVLFLITSVYILKAIVSIAPYQLVIILYSKLLFNLKRDNKKQDISFWSVTWCYPRSPHCCDASSQRSLQCGLPASLEWRHYHLQTSVTSFTPQKRVIGTNSAFLTCSWAALRRLSLCSWKPKAQPSLALLAWPLGKVSPLSHYPWSLTPGELAESRGTISVGLEPFFFSRLLNFFLFPSFSATFVEGRATGGWKAPLLLR